MKGIEEASARISTLIDNVGKVIVGKREVTQLAVCALLSEGHVLIEDVPGVGKTMLAKALARSVQGAFSRIQFTADLLPSDIIGASVWNQVEGDFEFRPGPIFGNVVLADEINRAAPRTQSALLECMGEFQVSVDRITHRLERPFFVLATQNPIEREGTYPLPLSQLDRFLIKVRMGYPKPEEERQMLKARRLVVPLDELEPVMGKEEVISLQQKVREVHIDESIYEYVVEIVSATRSSGNLALGASPRTSLALARTAQAWALCEGRGYLVPDDIKRVAGPVLAHRVIAKSPIRYRGEPPEEALKQILAEVPVPM